MSDDIIEHDWLVEYRGMEDPRKETNARIVKPRSTKKSYEPDPKPIKKPKKG